MKFSKNSVWPNLFYFTNSRRLLFKKISFPTSWPSQMCYFRGNFIKNYWKDSHFITKLRMQWNNHNRNKLIPQQLRLSMIWWSILTPIVLSTFSTTEKDRLVWAMILFSSRNWQTRDYFWHQWTFYGSI